MEASLTDAITTAIDTLSKSESDNDRAAAALLQVATGAWACGNARMIANQLARGGIYGKQIHCPQPCVN